MSQMKNVKSSKGGATPSNEVGAPTRSYGGGKGGKGRNNLRPAPIVNK